MDSNFHVCKFGAGQTMLDENQWLQLFGRLLSSLQKSIIYNRSKWSVNNGRLRNNPFGYCLWTYRRTLKIESVLSLWRYFRFSGCLQPSVCRALVCERSIIFRDDTRATRSRHLVSTTWLWIGGEKNNGGLNRWRSFVFRCFSFFITVKCYF